MRFEISGSAGRRGSTRGVRTVLVALAICAFASVGPAATENRILFAAGTDIPRPVQDFAWFVIETRCSYQAYELRERSFWAHHAAARRVDRSTAYSIEISSDVAWKKTVPPATIAMTILDDGRLHLTAIRSSFITCAN